MACKDWEGCSPEEEKAWRLAREAEDKVNKLLADNSRNESMLANEIDSLQLKVNNLTALLCDSCYILSEHNLINGKINTHIN